MPSTMPQPPQQWHPVMQPQGMVAPPPMVEMKPWWQRPMFQQLGPNLLAAGQQAAQGLAQLQQMRPEDVLTPDVVDAEEAQRQLRMERARQWYERRFGQAAPAGASMQAQGQQEGVDALLRRIQVARQMHNWRPGRA